METEKEKGTTLSNSAEENNPISPITNTSNLTYYEHRDNDGSGLEFDLVFLREKGVPLKYLSITVQGLDLNANPPYPNSATITISTQKDFDKIKNFIAQLTWE